MNPSKTPAQSNDTFTPAWKWALIILLTLPATIPIVGLLVQGLMQGLRPKNDMDGIFFDFITAAYGCLTRAFNKKEKDRVMNFFIGIGLTLFSIQNVGFIILCIVGAVWIISEEITQKISQLKNQLTKPKNVQSAQQNLINPNTSNAPVVTEPKAQFLPLSDAAKSVTDSAVDIGSNIQQAQLPTNKKDGATLAP